MTQGLQAILGELGSLMIAPDADVQFLQALQQAIVGKVKQATAQAIAGGQGGPPGQPNPGGRGGTAMGFGGAAPQMQQDQAGGPGTAGPGGMPNADEFRRMVGATNG
jgi:hypothetical protein